MTEYFVLERQEQNKNKSLELIINSRDDVGSDRTWRPFTSGMLNPFGPLVWQWKNPCPFCILGLLDLGTEPETYQLRSVPISTLALTAMSSWHSCHFRYDIGTLCARTRPITGPALPGARFSASRYASSVFTEKMTCAQPQYLLDRLIIAALHSETGETQVRRGYGERSCDCVFMGINWDKWWSGSELRASITPSSLISASSGCFSGGGGAVNEAY